MVSSQRHNTLIHFRYNPEHKAQRGEHGMGSNCTGLDGRSITLQVPVGTALYDMESGELVHDFQEPDEQYVIAKGGRGGRGNQHFATSTHQAPREHELGRAGEERHYRLELKLLADVGLVGYPNAGKSTLISAISAARPKIADYPFTTLVPHLGVVTSHHDHRTLVVADIPGLIEGAHRGAGLGIRFLKHVERCRLLCHLVDASAEGDAEKDVATLESELTQFSPEVALRPRIVVASKCDAVSDPERLASIRRAAERRGLPYLEISAATGAGTKDLVGFLFHEVAETLAHAAAEPAQAAAPAADPE